MRTAQLVLVQLLSLQLLLSASQQSEDKYVQLKTAVQQMVALIFAGNNAGAITIGEPALRQARALLGGPDLIEIEMCLALAYLGTGREQDAESLYLAVVQSSTGPSAALRDAQFFLAMLADRQGRVYEANQRLRVAFAVAQSRPSDEAPAVLRIRNSLAQSDLAMGNAAEALELSWQNLDYLKTQPEEVSHNEELFNLRTLASIYRSIGDRKREDDTTTRLQHISKTIGEKQSTELTIIARDRDRFFADGQFGGAIKLELEYESKYETIFGASPPLAHAKELEFIAQAHYAAGETQLALVSFRQSFEFLHQAFDPVLPLMTDSQRNEFAIQLENTLNIFFSMCYKYRTSHPEWLGEMYNLVLWQKNLVSRSLRQQQQLLASSRDDQLRQLQTQLKDERIKVAEASRENSNAPLLSSLRQSEYEIEKQIAQRLSQLSPTTSLAPKVTSILKMMRPTDAAVEIVRLPFNDGPAPTPRVLYLALVARVESQQSLTMVELGDAESLEQDQISLIKALKPRGFKFVANTDETIQASNVWKALELSLKGAKRVYLSPAGIFNQTAFFAWKASDGSFLIDNKDLDLRPVSSTGALLERSSTTAASSALLIGNPNFNQPALEASVGSGAESANQRASGCIDEGNSDLKCLPNSGREVESIYSTLKHHGWDVLSPLEDTHASKSAVLASRHPRVLHLATHGFFAELNNSGSEVDPVALEMELESSGLFFAGASLTLRHQLGPSSDNGVLTAFEALNLDLDGTELVVLSACDTGRGELSNADEVLGLRRSFQVAGARGILMSMWNVDDPATTELMTNFYQEWATSGDAYAALRKAALQIKKDRPNPYYWAPFVLYAGK